ncbi:MAG: hypothetical protein LBP59_16825 [Planctomycetaceae bacterium]|nr:hypothetical protein [Planctomycetaceae bacterium]
MADALEKYSHFRKIDYSTAKLLNKNEKETVIKNIFSKAKKQRAEQNSASFEINAIGSQPNPILRNDFLDAVFVIDPDNRKDILKITTLLEGSLNAQNVKDDFKKKWQKVPPEIRNNEELDASTLESLTSWALERYTYNEETVWANFKVSEIFNGNRKQIWTCCNGIQDIKIDTSRGCLGYSIEANQVLVNEINSRYPDEWGFFFHFFFLPFHDDKTLSNFTKSLVKIYRDDNFLYFLMDGWESNYITDIICCDATSYNVIVYRNLDKKGNVVHEIYQFDWTIVDRGISIPKITIEGRYDPDSNKRGKEIMNYYAIRYLQKIEQFPTFNDNEFKLACKKGTDIIDYRIEEEHQSFMLDQDVSDILDYMWTVKPIDAEKLNNDVTNNDNNNDLLWRIICVMAGIMSLVVAMFIIKYQKKRKSQK